MDYEAPFDSIESAHEFVDLLAQVVRETRHDIEADMQRATSSNSSRLSEALQITVYKMQTLEFHLKKSRRILNDLRSLRRLLVGKLTNDAAVVPPESTGIAAKSAVVRPIGIARAEASPLGPSPEASRLEDDEALLGLTG